MVAAASLSHSATGWAGQKHGLLCWHSGHVSRPSRSSRHPAESARARMSASPSAAGLVWCEMHGAISHHTIGIRSWSPIRASPAVPGREALLALAGGPSAGGLGTAISHFAPPSSGGWSMAVPPLGRALLNLASLPSSRNWAIQASISCALTSSGEILTFISKPSLRYTKLADGLRHASRRVKVLARPPAQPNALRAEAAAEEVGLL